MAPGETNVISAYGCQEIAKTQLQKNKEPEGA